MTTERSYKVSYDPDDTGWRSSYVKARSRSQAKYCAWLNSGAADWLTFRQFLGLVKSVVLADKPPSKGEVEAKAWNATVDVGTEVRFWSGFREGPGRRSRTRTQAYAMGDHASVWVEDCSSCIALSHVQVITANAQGNDDDHARPPTSPLPRAR